MQDNRHPEAKPILETEDNRTLCVIHVEVGLSAIVDQMTSSKGTGNKTNLRLHFLESWTWINGLLLTALN